MERVTFIESIIKILNLIASVPFFIEILVLSLFLLLILIFFYFRKSKKGKITCLIIYIVTLFLIPVSHLSFFANTLDKIIENYIEILYFPSCYVYIALLIITDVSILRKIINNVKSKQRKWYQSFEFVYFFIFQFLFFLIIRTVISEKIDIFERAQLYGNTTLTSLIQISSYLFWIRIGVKGFLFIINKLSKNEPNINKDKIADNNKIILNTEDGLRQFNNKNESNISIDLNSNKVEPVNFIIETNNTNVQQQSGTNVEVNNNQFGVVSEKEKNTELINNTIINSVQNTNLNTSVESKNINFDLNNDDENDNFFDDFYE